MKYMKRFFILTITLFIAVLCINYIAPVAISDTRMRNYKPINIAKGSFLKAINLRDISTSTVKVGDIFPEPYSGVLGEKCDLIENAVYIRNQFRIVTECVPEGR